MPKDIDQNIDFESLGFDPLAIFSWEYTRIDDRSYMSPTCSPCLVHGLKNRNIMWVISNVFLSAY